MTVTLSAAAINLFVALSCGAVIGSERQVRQRMAGLRTNALVALGAASFVTFSGLFPDEVSPTRVAAREPAPGSVATRVRGSHRRRRWQ